MNSQGVDKAINMAKKSLFSRIASSMKAPKERTSEELDKELEDAVKSIKDEEIELLDASDLLSGGWGEDGETVFIMSLKPIYEIIGSSKGRMADGLREACNNIFDREIEHGRGRGKLTKDNFVMRFSEPKETGFWLAAGVINAIGQFILSERFKTLEIPNLLTVANVDDIINEDGSFDMKKIFNTVKSGGKPIKMEEPEDDSPKWFQLFWKANKAISGLFSSKTKETDDPDWGKGTFDEDDPDREWEHFGHKKGQKNELTPRGPDRRQNNTKVNPRRERRLSWRGRRRDDG